MREKKKGKNILYIYIYIYECDEKDVNLLEKSRVNTITVYEIKIKIQKGNGMNIISLWFS